MNAPLALEVWLSLCIQVTIIVSVCCVLQRSLDDVRWSCRLWTICFVSIIGFIAAGLLLPHRRLFGFPDLVSRETMQAVVAGQEQVILTLLSVWALGVAFSLARKAAMYWHLMRFLRYHCRETDGAELARVWSFEGVDAAEQVQMPGSLRVLASAAIQGPFCWQFHRPTIVLSERLLAEDGITLRHVLLHEIEHLRTKHPMQHFLQGVCSTIFWFHPAVWLAARNAEMVREFLCDEVTAMKCGKFSAYLRTLAKVAEQCDSASCATAAQGRLAFGNRKSALIRRTDRLVELAQNPRQPTRYRPVIVVAVFVTCVLLIQQVWLPTNMLASSRSAWSPWPTWTATALHNLFDVRVRDFETFEERVRVHEWTHEN